MSVHLQKLNKRNQFFISVTSIILIAAICFPFTDLLGYRVVALILLVTVSILAMLFNIIPVLFASALSALIWNFFFIPPLYTFHIGNAEDTLMFLLYFIIALINATLTFQIRKIEKVARRKELKENTFKLYNTLLNSLSHELRTPISTIIAATDNLQTNKNKLTAENEKELVEEIAKASFRLDNQVENLLNMSRIESGFLQPKKDWCDVNELIFDTLNQLKEISVNHLIKVNIADNFPLCKMDEGLMGQAIYNLIQNAIIYTANNSVITISASIEHSAYGHFDLVDRENVILQREKEIDQLILKIEDNGTGFPANEIASVFDKFYRLKNSKPGGTGLGLSIAKGFVEAHKGKIILENTEPAGAKFTISLPVETSYLNNLKNE